MLGVRVERFKKDLEAKKNYESQAFVTRNDNQREFHVNESSLYTSCDRVETVISVTREEVTSRNHRLAFSDDCLACRWMNLASEWKSLGVNEIESKQIELRTDGDSESRESTNTEKANFLSDLYDSVSFVSHTISLIFEWLASMFGH